PTPRFPPCPDTTLFRSAVSTAKGAMPERNEFRVAVTNDNLVFASAHFIIFPGHRCERLHGHNYRTRVVVEGGLDPEAHYVFDFRSEEHTSELQSRVDRV